MTDESLKFRIKELEETIRLMRRQMELSLTHNPHQYGQHSCCPCVKGLEQYPRKALGL